jgi:hypothetical protein
MKIKKHSLMLSASRRGLHGWQYFEKIRKLENLEVRTLQEKRRLMHMQ